jgi:hypothetical protein
LIEHDSKDPNSLRNSQRRNGRMNNITTGAALSMSLGLILLIIYCSINLYNMPEDKSAPKGPGEEKFAVPSYVPSVPTSQPAAPNNPTSPPPAASPEKPANTDSSSKR